MMKRFTLIRRLLLLSLLFCAFSGSRMAEAEVAEGFSIAIQKYKLDASTPLADAFPQDGTKAEAVKDAKGNALLPLAGIQYEIVRVTPLTEGNGFQLVEGAEAFTTTVTTDATGLAKMTGLPQGMYRVVEKPASVLADVMEPVILELPLPQPNGKEALKEVYLYPKSGVITGKTPGKTPGETPVTRLPQTSGNIGDYQPFVYIFVLLFVMGILGLMSMRQKKMHNER